MEFILTFDDKVIRFINDNMRSRFLDKAMKLVSASGNYGIVWIAAAFSLIAMGGEKRRAGLFMIASLMVEASACNLIIKPSVKRVRPNDAHGLVISIDRPKDYSFPSGHTAAAFAAAYSLYLSNKRSGIWMLYSAAVMGFSRVYLLVHYPMDVVAGAAIGMLSAGFVHRKSSK